MISSPKILDVAELGVDMKSGVSVSKKALVRTVVR